MLMTKEALKESYVLHNENIQSPSNDYSSVWIFIFAISAVILLIFLVFSIASNNVEMFGIGLILVVMFVFGALLITSVNSSGSVDEEEEELKYKINTIMPYLFKNAETASTLKRYDKIDIQIDQEELLRTGAIMGQVVIDDNGNEIIYPFKQVTLGVTSDAKSYVEVNELDVALNEEYPIGRAFHVLYLNNEDYTMFMNLFGEIPIRIEK